jgi:poly(3-hydroxyalkanoate) synthetase
MMKNEDDEQGEILRWFSEQSDLAKEHFGKYLRPIAKH